MWKTISVAPKYEVHSAGLVRNRKTKTTLQPWTHRSGHQYVKLTIGAGRKKGFQVHRLVLNAFVGPAPKGKEARHIDGIPSHNCLQNLKWGTRLENIQDLARATGKAPRAKLTFQQAEQIREEYSGQRGDKRRLAKKYGSSESSIGRIIAGTAYQKDLYS